MKQIFISYSRKDTDFTRRLTDMFSLVQMESWVDWQDIPPSVDWILEIYKGIEEADIFVFVLSPDSIKSQICKQEIEHAIRNNKRIIPVIARELESNTVFPELKHLNWINFNADRFEKSFEKLLNAVRTDYDWVQTHRRLQNKALEWEKNDKEKSLLLRGQDLQLAEAQLTVNENKDPRPTELQRVFISKSKEEEQHETQIRQEREKQIEIEKATTKRLRRLTNILLAVFTVVFIGTYYWFYQYTTSRVIQLITDNLQQTLNGAIAGMDKEGFVRLYEEESKDNPLCPPKKPDENTLPTENGYYPEDNPLYIDHENWLLFIQNIQPFDARIYTFRQGFDPGEIIAIGSTGYFREPRGGFRFCQRYTSTSTRIFSGLSSQVNLFDEPYTDSFGSWFTTYAPIKDDENNVIGGIGMDISVNYLDEVRSSILNFTIISFIITYSILFILIRISGTGFTRFTLRKKNKSN